VINESYRDGVDDGNDGNNAANGSAGVGLREVDVADGDTMIHDRCSIADIHAINSSHVDWVNAMPDNDVTRDNNDETDQVVDVDDKARVNGASDGKGTVATDDGVDNDDVVRDNVIRAANRVAR
jgi:hypothetical protein